MSIINTLRSTDSTVIFIYSQLLVSFLSPFPVTLATVICKVYGWFDMTYNFVLVTEFSDFNAFSSITD